MTPDVLSLVSTGLVLLGAILFAGLTYLAVRHTARTATDLPAMRAELDALRASVRQQFEGIAASQATRCEAIEASVSDALAAASAARRVASRRRAKADREDARGPDGDVQNGRADVLDPVVFSPGRVSGRANGTPATDRPRLVSVDDEVTG